VEWLDFTKVKIVLETTKLMCKTALNFGVIFMSGLNIIIIMKEDEDNEHLHHISGFFFIFNKNIF